MDSALLAIAAALAFLTIALTAFAAFSFVAVAAALAAFTFVAIAAFTTFAFVAAAVSMQTICQFFFAGLSYSYYAAAEVEGLAGHRVIEIHQH